MASDFHVIFGTGPLEALPPRFLLNKGFRARMVNRSGGAPLPWMPSSGTEPGQAGGPLGGCLEGRNVLASARGHPHLPLRQRALPGLVPRAPVLHANLRAAALRGGAVLALAQDLYMYARGASLRERKNEVRPLSRKGIFQQALTGAGRYRRSQGLRWVSVRASDYFGPGADMQSVFGTVRFLDPLF